MKIKLKQPEPLSFEEYLDVYYPRWRKVNLLDEYGLEESEIMYEYEKLKNKELEKWKKWMKQTKN